MVTIPAPEPTLAPKSVTSDTLSCLFSPYQIGPITLANRFIMPAMQRGFCKGGAPLPELADYYRKRVEGGIALVIGESCAIDHPSATGQPKAAILDARSMDAWARCIGGVREAGGEMMLQLWHEGGRRKDGRTDDILTPSGLVHSGKELGRAMTRDDLEVVRDAYVRSARYAQQAGATGIEVHCAHGYLIDQFLWDETNLRGDEYGGPDLAQRMRYPLEVIAAIRDACGPDILISARLSQWKGQNYSARIVPTPDELTIMTSAFHDAGVDVFHASTRRFWIPEWLEINDWGFAGWIKHVSGLPTITVGSVGLNLDFTEVFSTEHELVSTLPESLSELVRRFKGGEFDLVAVGRSLIGDPDWVNKVRAGDLKSIRPFSREDLASL